jgi:hypothetical protein
MVAGSSPARGVGESRGCENDSQPLVACVQRRVPCSVATPEVVQCITKHGTLAPLIHGRRADGSVAYPAKVFDLR